MTSTRERSLKSPVNTAEPAVGPLKPRRRRLVTGNLLSRESSIFLYIDWCVC